MTYTCVYFVVSQYDDGFIICPSSETREVNYFWKPEIGNMYLENTV